MSSENLKKGIKVCKMPNMREVKSFHKDDPELQWTKTSWKKITEDKTTEHRRWMI